ncbi:MAG: hypothetical protein LUG99_17540 [Lachnospiraceae bacterium]|nr:hypothetical protein [Lachnospiraceae bacterium]
MDFNRMLHEKKFYLAVLLSVAAIIAGTTWPETKKDVPLTSGTFLELLNSSLQSQTVLFVLPLAAMLPCGEEYLREKDSHFLRFLIIRNAAQTRSVFQMRRDLPSPGGILALRAGYPPSRARGRFPRSKVVYCLDKVVTTALSGAIVWLLGAFFAGLFFFLLFFSREALWNWPMNTIFTLLATLGRILLSASSLASLSAVAGVLGGSVYLAFGVPFLLWYACIILRERYFETLYCIDPTEWILAENDWGNNQMGLWIFLLILALFCAALHWIVLDGKLREI